MLWLSLCRFSAPIPLPPGEESWRRMPIIWLVSTAYVESRLPDLPGSLAVPAAFDDPMTARSPPGRRFLLDFPRAVHQLQKAFVLHRKLLCGASASMFDRSNDIHVSRPGSDHK
jgi:hypothetical protein